jgi:UTP--glucose-1-phosphate uridylyltransferase
VDLDETQAVMKKDLIALLAKAQGKAADSLAEELEAFEVLFHQYLVDRRAAASTVTWDKIENLPSSAVKSYGEDIPEVNMSQAKDLLNKLVVLKLNGGLGTSMGCQGPKSLITVRNDQTFLDLTVRQIETLNQQYGCHVPLVLMNSFYTHEDTLKIKPKYERRVKLHMFVQSCYPRIDRETLRPLADSPKSSDEW